MDGALREMRSEDGVLVPKAVIGTNAWGDALYGKMVRGSYVTEDVMLEAVKTAVRVGIPFFDTARDYGLGKGQAIVGRLCGDDTVISAKYKTSLTSKGVAWIFTGCIFLMRLKKICPK